MHTTINLGGIWQLTDGIIDAIPAAVPGGVSSALKGAGMAACDWPMLRTWEWSRAFTPPDFGERAYLECPGLNGEISLNNHPIKLNENVSRYLMREAANRLTVCITPPISRAKGDGYPPRFACEIPDSPKLRMVDALIITDFSAMTRSGGRVDAQARIEAFTSGAYTFTYSIIINDALISQQEFFEDLGAHETDIWHTFAVDRPENRPYKLRLSVARASKTCDAREITVGFESAPSINVKCTLGNRRETHALRDQSALSMLKSSGLRAIFIDSWRGNDFYDTLEQNDIKYIVQSPDAATIRRTAHRPGLLAYADITAEMRIEALSRAGKPFVAVVAPNGLPALELSPRAWPPNSWQWRLNGGMPWRPLEPYFGALCSTLDALRCARLSRFLQAQEIMFNDGIIPQLFADEDVAFSRGLLDEDGLARPALAALCAKNAGGARLIISSDTCAPGGEINVNTSHPGEYLCTLYSMSGEKLATQTAEAAVTMPNVEGIYVLRLESDGHISDAPIFVSASAPYAPLCNPPRAFFTGNINASPYVALCAYDPRSPELGYRCLLPGESLGLYPTAFNVI